MRVPYQLPFWKTAPLIRLLLPLILGIIIEWYGQFNATFILVCIGSLALSLLLFYFFSPSALYYLRKLNAIVFFIFIAAIAMLLTWQRDCRHQPNWYRNFYTDSSILIVKLNEPLVEKSRSFKAEAIVLSVRNGSNIFSASGKLLLYFSKEGKAPNLQYGQIILVKKELQAIENSGNPGAFNYQRYAAFQQLYHQLFLQPADWITTNEIEVNFFQSFLFKTRYFVLRVLQQYIGNHNQELGIAEALLIGYKEDLDKDLVQAYSNTGVVHIIAISGLHLGLIFFVLSWFFNRLPFLKKSRHFKAILLISCLWLFSLLTGGAASVLRSAVMFSVIVIGKYYFKQSSIYNSLCASAFILLCYNPYYLWDVGFQLSYLAVIGIIILQEPIYRSVFFKNKVVRKVWQMITITLAAQIAAFPICIYYFHQFPNLFLITNLLVVPLSTIILFGEILLVILAGITQLATYIGILLTWLIHLMNWVIQFFNSYTFSVMDQIYANVFSTWLLYGLVAFICAWILSKNKKFLRIAIFFLFGFAGLHTYAKVQLYHQKKVIIYNISKYRAVDFIVANKHVFVGDSILKEEGLLQNFHLKPARIAMQVTQSVTQLPGLKNQQFYWQFYQKKIICIESDIMFEPSDTIIPIDVLLISGNPSLKIKDLVLAVKPAIIVFDGSNSLWKIEKWKKECEELLLRFHSVAKDGAFILDVNE